jgi:hypothetical protein
MVKAPQGKVKVQKPALDPSKIEAVDDAWPHFERTVRQLAKSGPQHCEAAKLKGSKAGRKSP